MTHHQHSDASAQHLLVDASPQTLTLPSLLQTYRLRLFYGDLHNHTGYSDGLGRPEEALRQMRARGLHFAAITDHGEFFDRETTIREARKWEATAQQVAALTGDEFLAIRGFEWSSPRQGHSNVWCSAGYTGYHDTGDQSMQAFYAWLIKAQPVPGAEVLASFNHPGREVLCFDGCVFVPPLDKRIVALECFNRGDDYGDAYFHALDRGWHVGAIGVSDHHGDDWGNPTFPRAGILAPALTLPQLQAALISPSRVCHTLTDAGPPGHGREGADGRAPASRVGRSAASRCLVSRPTRQPTPYPTRIVVEWREAHRHARDARPAAGRLVCDDSTAGCSGALVCGARAA